MAGDFYGCILALNAGATIVFTPVQSFSAAAQRVPQAFSVLTVREAQRLRAYWPATNVSRLRLMRVIGAALPGNLRTWLTQHVADRVINAFSSSEAGQIGELDPHGRIHLDPQVEICVVDEARRPVPLGDSGYLAVRSPYCVTEYLWDTELTGRFFDKGWFYTQDLVRQQPDGTLELLGRANDVLNIGGNKRSPYPLEEQIACVPGVVDCVLLADSQRLGPDTLLLCIESEAPPTPAELQPTLDRLFSDEVSQILIAHFARFPRTHTGKIRRPALLAEYLQASRAKVGGQDVAPTRPAPDREGL